MWKFFLKEEKQASIWVRKNRVNYINNKFPIILTFSTSNF